MIGRGEIAPDFELEGVDGTSLTRVRLSLAQHRGRPTVLVFYPADNSPVCTVQLRSYSDDFAAFSAVDAQILAISPQTVDSHLAFARANGGFAFPLLADVRREVGDCYGVLGPVGFYRRSVVVVDGAGVIRHAEYVPTAGQHPDYDAALAVLAKLV